VIPYASVARPRGGRGRGRAHPVPPPPAAARRGRAPLHGRYKAACKPVRRKPRDRGTLQNRSARRQQTPLAAAAVEGAWGRSAQGGRRPAGSGA
jgi:hypothetical protein